VQIIITDRDPIVAVIKGSAVNQNGITGNSITTPSGDAQVELIQTALHSAQLSPTDIGFVEAQGTATPLGDAVEIESLLKVSSTDLLFVQKLSYMFTHLDIVHFRSQETLSCWIYQTKHRTH
jgi:acyl transferase domain-containing protein